MNYRSCFQLIVFGCLTTLLLGCSSKEGDKEEIYPIYKVILEPESISIFEGESFQLSLTVFPSNNKNYTVEWESNNTDIVTVNNNGRIDAIKKGDAIISATINHIKASCIVSVKRHIPAGAVDIGLSAYWAECNLGASNPEEYGDYYAWGEVLTKSSFSSDNYKWYIDGLSNKIIKYCPTEKMQYWGGEGNPDNLMVLDKLDDVANVLLGGNWHIPTYEEMAELIKTQDDKLNFEWTWIDNNGHYGWRVKYLQNGNSVFFPAAGFGGDDSYNNGFGAYWTSTLSFDYPYSAKALHFRDASYGAYFNDGAPRSSGFSIRPVSD